MNATTSGEGRSTAQEIYQTIISNHADKLIRLGDAADVRPGIAASSFLRLTPERIAGFGIEPEYCRPAMTRPEDSPSIAVAPAKLPQQLFVCNQDRELAAPGALAYIRWGEKQGYHKQKEAGSRSKWYSLGEQDGIHLGMHKLVDTTAWTFLAPEGVLFGGNFLTAHAANSKTAMRLCAAMNSTLFQLMLNAESWPISGEGTLEIQAREAKNLKIINPELLRDPASSAFNAADWDVLEPSAARRHIDRAVFDALGLTAGERDAVYAGVKELVHKRLKRTRNAPSLVDATTTAQIAQKAKFRVIPNPSGFAPGVNPDNLKDKIYESEEEEFLEKMGL